MKSLFSRTALLAFFFVYTGAAIAQTGGITSGAIYTIKSKSGNKLLNVSNASLDNSANVDCWTNTGSDAQRWIVTHIGNSVYTLTNVASGKLLHILSTPADSVNVDQFSDTGDDDVKWTIKKAGRDSFYLKSASDAGFSLNLHFGDTADGANVDLARSSASDVQRWMFLKVTTREVAPPATIADQVFAAWYNSYNIESVKGFFWDNAEMMEVVLDAYEVTKESKYKTMFDAMYKNFIDKNGADWQNNKYNDDIAWAVLFSVRGYLLTGNISYREKAKDQFDKMYARAFTNTYGGGLIWYQTKTSKNSCINGPAMVACCYLALATGDSTYYDKAIALYTWSKVYLFDSATGKLNDNVDLDKKTGQLKISTWSSTYNQGTYLGAAVMLYKYTKEASYLSEAQKIAVYIRDNMYKSKVMNNEDNGNDLPGFKGIFARYARMYTVELNKTDLIEWLQLNAKVAYNNRNSHDLIQTKWATRTSEMKPKSAFGCSTAVSLLMNSLPFTTLDIKEKN
jgi:predicted alpha-1,6-mannanase (GH76 family)